MRKGFTLIELLVVIAIIAILAAILFPVFGKAREKARQTHCTNNQKSFGTAVQIYTQEHDETFPKSETFWGDIRVDKAALKCMTVPSLSNGYVYNNSLAGKGIGEIPDPTNPAKIASADNLTLTADGITKQANGLVNILYTDKDVDVRHNDKCIAAYADGHVEMSTASALRGIEIGLMPPGPMDADYNTVTAFGATNGPMCSWVVTYDADGAGAGAAVPVTANEISPFPLANGANPSYTFKKFGVYKVTGTSTSMATNTSTWDVTIKAPFMTSSAGMAGFGLWVSADACPTQAADTAITSWPITYTSTVGKTAMAGGGTYHPGWKNSKPSIRSFTTTFKSGYIDQMDAVTFVFVGAFTGSAGQTWNIMCKKGDASTCTFIVGKQYNTALRCVGFYPYNGGEQWNMAMISDVTLTTPHYCVMTADKTANTHLGWRDGSPLPAADYNTNASYQTYPFPASTAEFIIGGDHSGVRFSGDIAEMMVFKRKLTPTEVDGINTYLKAKYGF